MSLRLAVSGAQVKQLKAVLHFLGKIGEACTYPALLGMTQLACSLSTHWRRRRAPHRGSATEGEDMPLKELGKMLATTTAASLTHAHRRSSYCAPSTRRNLRMRL
jgi:hypothetical protein